MNRRSIIYFHCFLIFVLLSCSKDEFTCDDFSVRRDISKIDRRVLIIGIDGFRSDAMQASISPFLYEFSQRSTTFYNDQHLVERLTFSGPNWSSLLTGVHTNKHHVTTNDFKNNHLVEFPHFFNYIELPYSSINTASIVSWEMINERIADGHTDYISTFDYSDIEVYQQAENILINKSPINPDILFVCFGGLDSAGHLFGYHSNVAEYASTLAIIDNYVNGLISIIEKKRLDEEDWMIFVVSDHGGDGNEHYGGYDNENIKYTIFYANHPEEKFNHSIKSSQVDLAPTVLDFMGIMSNNFSCKTDGISLIK